MKSGKSAIFFLAISLLVFIFCIVIFYAHIAVFIFARSNDIDISYKKLTTGGLTEFVFKDLKAIERKRGVGILSSGASVKLVFDKSPAVKTTADFSLNNVHFIRKGSEEAASYNNIDDLIALPFSSLLSYKTITGKVNAIKDGISVTDFLASGDTIRFSVDGTLIYGNVIDADISIFFDKELIGKIPPELTSMALKDGGDGWKSLTIKVEGDLAKPSIRVTGKLFRLNIGVK